MYKLEKIHLFVGEIVVFMFLVHLNLPKTAIMCSTTIMDTVL